MVVCIFSMHPQVKLGDEVNGEIIEEYFDDKPYPSFLALKLFDKPLHVVFARNRENDEMIVITAYYPDKEKWSDDYKTRIKK